jgi:hypothetical protein
MATSSVTYNKPVLPRVSDTSDLASNRASVYSGKALSFDGVNDQIQGASNTRLPNSNYTICSWFYMDTLKTQGIVTWGDDTTGERRGMLVWDGSPPGYYCLRSSTYASNPYGTTQLQAGVWYFGAVTVDSSGNASIYLNGELDGTGTNTLNAFSNTDYIVGNTRSGEWMDGKISSPRVFDVVLTATQIRELYNNPEQILPTGVSAVNLKLWLPMMEGAGSYVYNGAAGATGAELLANGTLEEVCQKWGLSDVSTIAITGGKIIWTNPASGGAFADQYISVSTGNTYRITFDYNASDGGFVYIGNEYTSIPSGAGTFTTDITYTSGHARLRIAYGSASALTASVDNVSVKEVVPQATGTISGATWVAGQGEPLPQTALIDWNKGTNLPTQSENFGSGDWVKNSITVVDDQASSPIAGNTADLVLNGTGTAAHRIYQLASAFSSTGYLSFGIYVKYYNHRYVSFGLTDDSIYRAQVVVDLLNGTIVQNSTQGGTTIVSSSMVDVGGGWYRLSGVVNATSNWANNLYFLGMILNQSSFTSAGYTGTNTGLYIWGAQASFSSVVDPYMTTGSSAQTSPVLLPKGLTTGKDIFGNSIVTPRASGAFNFDGVDSSARITKNASLNVSSLSVEAWVYPKNSGYQSIFQTGNANGGFHYYAGTSTLTQRLYINGSVTNASTYLTRNAWNHIVAVHDGATTKYYLNGALDVSTNNATGGANPMPLTEAWIGVTDSLGEDNEFQCSNVRLYNYALTANQVSDNFNQKASTFGKTNVTGELQAYINRTVAAGATVEAHSALLNTLTELENK